MIYVIRLTENVKVSSRCYLSQTACLQTKTSLLLAFIFGLLASLNAITVNGAKFLKTTYFNGLLLSDYYT